MRSMLPADRATSIFRSDNFLGRDRSIQPFLKTLGIKTPANAKGGGPRRKAGAGAAPPPKP